MNCQISLLEAVIDALIGLTLGAIVSFTFFKVLDFMDNRKTQKLLNQRLKEIDMKWRGK